MILYVADDNASPQREFFDDNVSQMPEFSMTEYLDTSDDYMHSQDSSQKHMKHDEGITKNEKKMRCRIRQFIMIMKNSRLAWEKYLFRAARWFA